MAMTDPGGGGDGGDGHDLAILHVIASTDPRSGGPIEAILQQEAVTRAAGSRGVREIVSLDRSDAPWLSAIGMPVHALGEVPREHGSWRHPLRRYGANPLLLGWLRANISRFDAAIVHGLWNFTDFAAARVLPNGDVPYFVFSHGMMDPWFRRRSPVKHVVKQLSWWLSEGPLLNGARRVLFTCEEERRQAEGGFLGQRYVPEIVGLGSSPPPRGQRGTLPEALAGLAGRPYVLFLGRIHEKKGCDLLIEGFGRCAAERPDVRLVIAGPDENGWQPALAAMAKAAGVADRLSFPGGLFGPDKWNALRNAEAFILPSHQENFGIAVAEALGCGVPVLISDKVNIWREIESAGAGLVAPDTVAGVERLLRGWFATPPADRARMADAATAVFEARFNIEHTAPALLRRIAALVGEARAGQAAVPGAAS